LACASIGFAQHLCDGVVEIRAMSIRDDDDIGQQKQQRCREKT
jgi:hypothetical protein